MDTSGNLEERDRFSTPFTVGTYVMVRCLVSAITPAAPGGKGGAADLITCVVESPGNVGEQVGVTFQVSPIQCKRTGSTEQY